MMNSLLRNKKLILSLIIFISLVGIVIGGFSIYHKEKSSATRTIMIYMVGSDLESEIGMATSDLKELNYKKTKANHTNVVLMAGGTISWQNNYIDVNETSIYKLEESGFEKVNTRPKEDMGSTENLLYFLNYSYDSYKTDKYDFIYWNHGGAVDGSEYDAFTEEHLMLSDMKEAFENSPFKGENKLEVMSFRTCLNGTIEIANLYKEYADYLIASEEIAYVTNTVSSLRFINKLKPNDTGVDFGRKQIDTYKRLVSDICEESTEEDCTDYTYSVIDLSKVTDLNLAFDNFSKDLLNHLPENYNTYAKLRSNMNQYADDIPYYDMVDLYNLTEQFDKYSENGNTVREKLEDTVVYNWSNTEYSHGLSVYFPFHQKLFLDFYDDISVSSNYTDFLQRFDNSIKSTSISSYSNFSNARGMVTKIEQEEAEIELELSDEQINNMATSSYLVFVDTKDGYYEMLYQGNDIKIENNKLKASVKGKLLRLSDYEYEDNSIWLSTKEIEVTNDYIDLKTVAVLSRTNSIFLNKNITAYLTIRIDETHPNGYIKSIYTYLEDANQEKKIEFAYSPVGIHLKDYNFISVMSARYKLLNEFGTFNPSWKEESNKIIRGESFKTDEIKLIKENFSSDYDYYVVFRVLDIANNEYDSMPIKLK